MQAWKTPETRSFVEAHERIRKIDPAVRRTIIREKREHALAEWARRRMGTESEYYLDPALKDYLTLLTICVERNPGGDVAEIARAIPFEIPDTVPRNWAKIPRSAKRGFLHPKQLEVTYRRVFTGLKEIKRKRWVNPKACRLSLRDALPGATREQIDGYYLELTTGERTASAIARVYVARKFKLTGGGETLKKLLRLARDPERLALSGLRDVERRWGGFPPVVKRLLAGPESLSEAAQPDP